MEQVTQSILEEVYPKREAKVHKYDFGLMLVIGGSEFYSGSPALAARAAFRAGVDMVHILAPQRAANIIASFSPNLAAYPLTGDYLNKEHLSTLIEMTEAAKSVASEKTSVVIGGGLGRNEETKDTILEYLSQVEVPVVIDADGIHALAKSSEPLKFKQGGIITPHSYEFYVLTGNHLPESRQEKVKLVQDAASEFNSIVLLKGAPDIISDGRRVALNKVGSSYMTTGGTGDSLAGICGSLLAQGVNWFEAAQAAAYINGKAGQIAAKTKNQGLVATDLIEAIPKAIQIKDL